MQEYEERSMMQYYLTKFICDRCKKEISVDDEMELQETYTINFHGGFTSVFGDMNKVTCDLCQHCLYELIGDFCGYNRGDEV